MALRAVRETQVIEVPRETMLTLMAQIPEMSDIVITVFAARRRRSSDEQDSTLKLIGEDEVVTYGGLRNSPAATVYPTVLFRSTARKRRQPLAELFDRAVRPAVIFGRDVLSRSDTGKDRALPRPQP